MNWFRLDCSLVSPHPKVSRFADALGIKTDAAIGKIVRFFAGVALHAEDGDLSEIPDSAIAGWMCWTKPATQLVVILSECGFIDEDRRVHGWNDRQERMVNARNDAKERTRRWREKKRNGNGDVTVGERDAVGVRRHVCPDTSPLLTVTTTTSPPPPKGGISIPEDLRPHEAAIRAWLTYHKPYKVVARTALWNTMRKLGAGLPAAIEHSMASGYQGLFPPKNGSAPQDSGGMYERVIADLGIQDPDRDRGPEEAPE